MAAPVQRDQQAALAQRDDAQDGVVHGELAVAAQLGGEALAVVAEGLPQAAGDGTERGGGALGEAEVERTGLQAIERGGDARRRRGRERGRKARLGAAGGVGLIGRATPPRTAAARAAT